MPRSSLSSSSSASPTLALRLASALALALALLLASLSGVFLESPVVVVFVEGHGTMVTPRPRQPESVYWYQVGCMIGCVCSGGGKEDYPSLESVDCADPADPANTDPSALTYNADALSPRGAWNRYMPWRAPGTSVPIDSCGIASGFLPDAAVQYPHRFSEESGIIRQGQRGTDLPPGPITRWEAGSIVDLSFYLVVNHGGGYQYRVCPTSGAKKDDGDGGDDVVVDEACFERNPLAFADGFHTVFHGDKTIRIPATDVVDGVVPEGHAWRRIPLPACNCDGGAYCAAPGSSSSSSSDRDFERSYDEDAATGSGSSGSGPYGSCPTGLQFVPPHIADGSWPEGYGYYVATLLASKGGDDEDGKAGSGFAGNAESPCAVHPDANACAADAANGCRWYPEKMVCYESRKIDGGDGGVCADRTDEAACLAGTQNGDRCTWYDSPSKTVCYHAESVGKTDKEGSGGGDEKNKNNSSSSGGDRGDGEWHITDRVHAPTEPGSYVLQWRWDNEQTPQIWTTCADIEVVPEGEPIDDEPTTTAIEIEKDVVGGGGEDVVGSGGAFAPPLPSLVVSSVLLFLAVAVRVL